MNPSYDLLIRNVRVVRPHGNVVHEADIAIRDGRFARVAPGIDPSQAKQVHERARPARLSPAWWTRTCTAASTRRWRRTR